MNGPPKKAPGEACQRTGRKLIDVPRAYHRPGLGQRGIIWKRWEREAARLFREFWSTGNQKHLRAFVRHIVAMQVYGGLQK
jgi:hypothetical protein